MECAEQATREHCVTQDHTHDERDPVNITKRLLNLSFSMLYKGHNSQEKVRNISYLQSNHISFHEF